MHRLNSFTQSWPRARLFAAWLAFMLFVEASVTAQVRVPRVSSALAPSVGASAADDLEARRLLALDAATVAARARLFDLSIDAAKRATEQAGMTVKPKFESTLLGGQPANSMRVSSNPRNTPAESVSQVALRQKLELLIDVWKEMEAPPEKIGPALQQIVIPANNQQAIQMFAPSEQGNVYNFNFELSTKPTTPPRILGFDAVDWAHKAGQLEALISVLEKRAAEPASQMPASALLIYAQRVAGHPEVVSKKLEDLLTQQAQLKGHGKTIFCALTKPLPENVAASQLDEAAVDDFVARTLAADPSNTETRRYMLQMLARAIKRGDRPNIARYTTAVESSIEEMNSIDSRFQSQLKTSFWTNAEAECRRQGQVDLAIDFLVKQFASGEQTGFYVGSYEDRLIALAEGSSQQRMERCERLLLKMPLATMQQLSFGMQNPLSPPPAFFQARDEHEETLPRLKPFEGSRTISLLDLLLNEAEARGTSEQIIDELFKNASDRDDIIKLLAQWLMFRAEKRGEQIPEKVAERGRFEGEQDFVEWVKRMPPPAAHELLAQHISKNMLSAPLLEMVEPQDASPQNAFRSLTSVKGFAEKYYQQQNPSAPPLRSVTELKHWCTAPFYSPMMQDFRGTVLEVPGPAGNQGLRYGGSTLMLRYPVVGDMTVKGTFNSSPQQSTTLGVNGVAVRLTNTATLVWRQRVGDTKPAVPLSDSSSIGWSMKGETLSLMVNEKVERSWRQSAAAFPFVSLSSDWLNSKVPADFEITGNLSIPREVALIDRGLTGWKCMPFGHALPDIQLAFEEIASGASDNSRSVRVTVSEGSGFVWRLEEGEIAVGKQPHADEVEANKLQTEVFGRSLEEENYKRQTLISYDRPLLEGERIEFELFHNTKAQTAAPVCGRLAYCFESEKVSLHWIAVGAELKRFNITEDNRADDPAGQQLAPVQLEDSSWNRLALRIEAGHVVLSIADKDVYRRPLAENESTLFGFFADPTAPETRIRNVVLKGDWPTELPKDLWELAD